MAAPNKAPYQQSAHPPVPTRFTRYLRRSLVWQGIRFFVIGFKVIKLMAQPHG